MYIAHKKEEQEQSMVDHLKGVAKLASNFAAPFQMQKYAYTMGMAHDIGKYSEKFQHKIKNNTNEQVDHSTAGARTLAALQMIMGSIAVVWIEI